MDKSKQLNQHISENGEGHPEQVNLASFAGESKFWNTVKQAPVGMIILRGEDFVVEMANDAYLSIVDRTEEELVGKSLFTGLPEVRDYVEPILFRVLRTGIAYHGNEFEVTIRRFGQPELCYFNFVYQPLFEEDPEQVSGIMVVATEVTQQVLSKHALQRSENQFRNLVTQSQFAKAILKGPELVISIANESMLNIWRRRLDEVEGKRLVDVFPELKGQKFLALLDEVYHSGQIYRENEAIAYVDGPGGLKKHYLDFQYAPISEIDGSVSGIMASVNDVTDKVTLRQQFAETADRLSLATDGTRLGTWDLNIQTKEIIYSGRMAVILGYDEDAVLTHSEMRDMIHPEDRHTIVEKAFSTALETGVYYYEARVIHRDQSVHWVRTQGKVFFGEGHVPLRMLGTMMDITDRKESELALKTSEGKFRTLADSMPQFVWTADSQGYITYFNRSLLDYSGFAAEEIERDGWLPLVHSDDLAESVRLWVESIAKGTEYLFEHRLKRADGEYRWYQCRAIPQRRADGTIEMWVGTSLDIHDSRLFIDQLETKVQERTQQLLVANNELVRTNMELAQFAYVASHDLQEPLRKIQTFATRILETERDNLSERGKDYFKRMQASSTRMQQLIVDLLAFSRANVGEKHLENTDLNLVLQNVKEQLGEVIQAGNAVIKSDVLPVREVVTYQFEQLFMNLITNAIKFIGPDRTPVIEIRSGEVPGAAIPLAEADATRLYQYISFADNGIGFDPQYKDRIFQVFQRLHNRSAYEGTGIGLAICKKIVENHKGLIDAVGKPGVGSTFIIYLPVGA
ncbi:PAS domain S-box-containing protein [Dyadobacter sp. BE34]|uniref:histidine kinase n=1 Tax=Dyadobacter fermentans TaxID=94254 RepID=A0ABU1R433_9BACT|nr:MULTISPECIES: PAS domain S-box protein [Dyadobacter]MDR6807340.1 PAS domain S-box-containing protein [Dyadobacter fermentans]MDR7045081.1 PAS domain S-box-containing protein [Dyadobacter sp. BE242]MDR7199183.1 PAS domain S-box-containing protein [Dyadobacter sp. BE34]MDR7217143.1 PAS domain S-box-containing protein [Dyadobacter sp. BE31]MDR7265076.1 PAS domain S-box-containing protein [Dyadobacter sp. BE32]